MKSLIAAAAGLLVFVSIASAQWMKDSSSTFPRTRDGKPDLAARAPRAADGKADFSGVWNPDPDPNGKPQGVEQMIFPQYFINIAADMKMEDEPILPEARALFLKRLQNDAKDSPQAQCRPTGVPMVNTVPLPYKIIQTPKLILMLYEENSVYRQIFLDGRQTVKDPEPRWMGYSSGKWEGDTLVVTTVGFNSESWLDAMGHPHSENMRLTERFRRRDAGHLEIEMTIADPKNYTRPLTYTQKATIIPNEDLLEYFCSDNEKDIAHYSKFDLQRPRPIWQKEFREKSETR